jgi:ATP-dependent protease HslVU (ClpYQ) peptidase subunit
VTTIAARFSTLEIAADSMVSGDDSFYLVEKLRRGKDSIYGGCGDFEKLLKFYQTIEAGGDLDSDLDVTILELRHDGIWIYESCIIPARIKNDFWAVGTGANYALAAMSLGKNPKDAIEIAAQFDPCTSAPIDYLKLEKRGGGKKVR